jgi:hypothetical protein
MVGGRHEEDRDIKWTRTEFFLESTEKVFVPLLQQELDI